MPQGKTHDRPFDTCGFTTHAQVAADRARAEKAWRPGSGHNYGDQLSQPGALGPHARPMGGRW